MLMGRRRHEDGFDVLIVQNLLVVLDEYRLRSYRLSSLHELRVGEGVADVGYRGGWADPRKRRQDLAPSFPDSNDRDGYRRARYLRGRRGRRLCLLSGLSSGFGGRLGGGFLRLGFRGDLFEAESGAERA